MQSGFEVGPDEPAVDLLAEHRFAFLRFDLGLERVPGSVRSQRRVVLGRVVA